MLDELSDFVRRLPVHLRPLWESHLGAQISFRNGKEIRIPRNGKGDPERGEIRYDDHHYHPPIDEDHLLGIAVNGWDWCDGLSCFFTYDLDSVANHEGGVHADVLTGVVDKIAEVPEAEIIRSKSGHGYHVRLYVDGKCFARTHTHHQENATRALKWLGEQAGIKIPVDCSGVMAWIYHQDTRPGGLELIKSTEGKITVPDRIPTPQPLAPVLSADEYLPVDLSPRHRELINELTKAGMGDWDSEAERLTTHTAALKQYHKLLDMKGEFDTVASGKDLPSDRNCFAFPVRQGAWMIIRYHKGTKETADWHTTDNGWTACYLNKAKKKDKQDPTDRLVDACLDEDTFFHSPSNIAYVETMRRGHRETLLANGEAYKRLLRIRYRKLTKSTAKAEHIKNALNQLAAIAIEEGPKVEVFVRLGSHDGKLYLDMLDEHRTVLEIDGDGWQVCKHPPIRFARSDQMLALPMPVDGGTPEDFREFCNVSEEDWPLFVGALVGLFHPTGPYAVIHLIGGDGRAKTSLARVIQSLVDPSIVVGCAPPKKDEDLMLAAMQRWIIFHDNLSVLPDWLSDAYCRLTTGGANERRTLYSDADTSVFIAKRPLVLTSIVQVMDRNDLKSRTLTFELPPVIDRKPEGAFNLAFETARPKLLGTLLRGVSQALRDPRTVDDLPRLADFAAWVHSAEPAFGFDDGTILKTFQESRDGVMSDTLGGALCQAILGLPRPWKGTGKELAETIKWPYTSDRDIQDMVGEFRSLVSVLQSQGILVKFKRSNGKKIIHITDHA